MSPPFESIVYVPAGYDLSRVAVLDPPVDAITTNEVPPDKLEKLSGII